MAGHPLFQISEAFLLHPPSEGFASVPTTEAAMFMEAGAVAFELIFEMFGKHVGVSLHKIVNVFFVCFHTRRHQFKSMSVVKSNHHLRNAQFLLQFELVADFAVVAVA